MTAPVSFQHGDATWTQYRERARKDLYWLASVVLGYGELVPMTEGAHALLCHFVQRSTGVPALDTAKYRKVELARGWGKSTVVTRARAIQLLLRDPNTAILIANEKEQTAVDFLAEIKAHFETNQFLRALFPELIPEDFKDTTWSATRIVLNRSQPRPEPSIGVIGVGGTVTGAHPDVIIVDDAISREAMENARAGSWDVMHKVNRWIHQLVPLLNPNAKPFPELIFIGCVAGGQRVLMGNGTWRPIESVIVGDTVASWDANKQRFIPQPVTGVWPQGIATTVHVTTQRHETIVTPTHPFLTDRGYVPASNLKRGERIYTVGTLTAPMHGRKSMIPGWRQASPDRLWMLGYLWGDGWVTKYVGKTSRRGTSWCVCAATGVYEHRNTRIATLLSKEFGGRVYETDFGYIRLDNNKAGRILETLGLLPGVRAPYKRLPSWLWGMRPAEKRAFLRGLIDADGHLAHGKEYRLSTSSQGLADDVRMLALTCGVRPSNIWGRIREALAPNSKLPTLSAEYVLSLVFEPRDELRAQRVVSVRSGVDRPVYDLSVAGTENFVTEGFVVHNTRWWYGDCYEHVEEHFGYGEKPVKYNLRLKLSSGEVQQLMAYRLGDLAVFRRPAIEDGRSAFPEKWSLDDLAKIRVGDEVLFSCNYLLSPTDNLTATFKADWLHYYDWLDERTVQFTDGSGAKKIARTQDLDVLVFVDPGGFTQRTADQRARAAVCVTGSTGKGEHLLLEAYSEQDTFLAAIRKVVEFCTRYSPRKLVVELAGQQAAFIEILRKALSDAGLLVTVEPVTPGMRQKEQRILQLEPWFQRGHVFVGRGPQFHEFRTQYSQFPRAARFDLLDALSYAPAVWKKQPGAAQQSPEDRRAHELSMYRARRGFRA